MDFKPFFLRGEVVHGKGRGGSQLGFPTANIGLNTHVMEELLPYKDLVLYGWGSVVPLAGKSAADGMGPYPVAMSIGYNPHFHEKALTAEVHFLHKFNDDFYGAVVKVAVLGVIRGMQAYKSLEALVEAINEDIRQTKEALQKPEFLHIKDLPLLTPSLGSSENIPFFEKLNT
ncbi:riboflavin kinase [Trypanosoma theileri]|uniref:riboflavin kinase n=1 Tax=Trypanosoma theileri TaxID=67003 RepID=A0A1X0P5M5_9TRYP|nr:riboflavin kinase [Trypanosoma theileri]ORC92148.1 riboflavin kinase [Trypanosoma theileri]